MITCTNVSKSYKGTRILRSLNFQLRRNSIVALVGPSGAGKSTLLRLIAGLEAPDSGAIAYGDDLECEASTSAERRKAWPQLTVVFQQLFLWPHLTLKQNILLPLRWRKKPGWESRFSSIVEQMGIDDVLGLLPRYTSQGQRQLASLARAMMLEPRCMLLDEVTSALDIARVSVVGRLLDEERRRGAGVVLVTHMLPFAEAVADRVLHLEHGVCDEYLAGQRVAFDQAEFANRFKGSLGRILPAGADALRTNVVD